MVEEESELIRDIAETQDHLEEKLETLETRLRRSVDVREHVRARPWFAVCAAATAGFLVGLARGRPRERAAAGEGFLRELGLVLASGLARGVIHSAAPELAASVGRRLRASLAPGREPVGEPASQPAAPRDPTLFDRTSSETAEELLPH